MWTYEFVYKCCICGTNTGIIYQAHENGQTRDICESCADSEDENNLFDEEE